MRDLAVELAAPRVVEHTGGEGEIVFGEPEGPPTERVHRVAKVLTRAGIPHSVSVEMLQVEVDALSGAVVHREKRHDLAVPVHEVILACLTLHQPAPSARPAAKVKPD